MVRARQTVNAANMKGHETGACCLEWKVRKGHQGHPELVTFGPRLD